MSLPSARDGWILGLDVSKAQGLIDAVWLRDDGVSFLYAKATDGEHSVDAQWEATVRSCAGAELLLGAYGVLEPYGPERAEAQAVHFVERVKDSGAVLAPWLDFELAHGLSAASALEAAAIWCDAVEEKLDRRVMVYAGPAFIAQLDRLAGAAGDPFLERLATRPLVVAHYTQSFDSMPAVPAPWSDWTIWQASGDRPRGPLRGSGNYSTLPWNSHIDVDVDWFRGTVADLVMLGCPSSAPTLER